jgi:hypothetical protein
MAVLDGAMLGYRQESALAAFAAADAKLMGLFLIHSGVLT